MTLHDHLVEAGAEALHSHIAKRERWSELSFDAIPDVAQGVYRAWSAELLNVYLDSLEVAHQDWADHRASECHEAADTGAMVACLCPSDAQVLSLIAALRKETL